ncbi:Retrovirus-related Pol polyprotein, partial [Mucuna pruriens]
MDRIFKKHIGNQLEIYVDNMVVKLETEGGHADSLSSIFVVLRKHQLKLNPEKCSFGVRSNKGIEANLEKCNAVINMRSPKCVKESMEKSAPIFRRLRKAERFKWTDDFEATFQEFKVMLAAPPILTWPVIGKSIYVYISISDNVVSSIIVQEGEDEQRPIYYVNKALQGAK